VAGVRTLAGWGRGRVGLWDQHQSAPGRLPGEVPRETRAARYACWGEDCDDHSRPDGLLRAGFADRTCRPVSRAQPTQVVSPQREKTASGVGLRPQWIEKILQADRPLQEITQMKQLSEQTPTVAIEQEENNAPR